MYYPTKAGLRKGLVDVGGGGLGVALWMEGLVDSKNPLDTQKVRPGSKCHNNSVLNHENSIMNFSISRILDRAFHSLIIVNFRNSF